MARHTGKGVFTYLPRRRCSWAEFRRGPERPDGNTHRRWTSAITSDNVQTLKLTLRQEGIEGANYQYSHGLQKHKGNCQRIAHGHRSALEIYCNGVRDEALEQQWARQWRDIYLGAKSHIKTASDTSITFAYQAPQGRFELTLPKQCCYLLETESTVEYIAEHIGSADLKEQNPDCVFQVKAFEGVSKGAIARS